MPVYRHWFLPKVEWGCADICILGMHLRGQISIILNQLKFIVPLLVPRYTALLTKNHTRHQWMILYDLIAFPCSYVTSIALLLVHKYVHYIAQYYNII